MFFPFIPDNLSGTVRTSNSNVFKKTTMLEIKLQETIAMVNKLFKKCRKNKSKDCRRVRELRRSLKLDQQEIHKGRSAWKNLTVDEQKSFEKRFESQVETYASVAKRMSKDVKRMKKEQKRRRLARKRSRNSLNQIPRRVSGKRHRVRHRRKKFGKRRFRLSRGKSRSKE